MAQTLVAQRRSAAEDVCWGLLVLMTLGGLQIPLDEREFIGGSFEKWADLAVRTGELKDED